MANAQSLTSAREVTDLIAAGNEIIGNNHNLRVPATVAALQALNPVPAAAHNPLQTVVTYRTLRSGKRIRYS